MEDELTSVQIIQYFNNLFVITTYTHYTDKIMIRCLNHPVANQLKAWRVRDWMPLNSTQFQVIMCCLKRGVKIVCHHRQFYNYSACPAASPHRCPLPVHEIKAILKAPYNLMPLLFCLGELIEIVLITIIVCLHPQVDNYIRFSVIVDRLFNSFIYG